MEGDLIQTAMILQSPNQIHRYQISVSDDGELVATKLVFKHGNWSEPRPAVARRILVPVALGSEDL
jgi:hypothetical protein